MLQVAVVDDAGHQRPVGVAFEELDHHFHADAREELATPLLAGMDLGNPDRAAFLRLAVPMELHPDPAVLVGADLFALFAFLGHDFGGLYAMNARLLRQRQIAERPIALQEFIVPVVVLIWVALVSPTAAAILLGRKQVAGAYDQVFLVFRL